MACEKSSSIRSGVAGWDPKTLVVHRDDEDLRFSSAEDLCVAHGPSSGFACPVKERADSADGLGISPNVRACKCA